MKNWSLRFVSIILLAASSLQSRCQVITTYVGNGTNGFNGDLINATSAELSGCIYVTADRFGNIYVSDMGNNRIRKINSSGVISTIAGCGVSGYSGDGFQATDAKLNTPHGITVDKYGTLYIADAGNNCIREVSTSGIISTIAGDGYAGFTNDGGFAYGAELNFPCGITTDTLGNIFIADTYNNCIRRINQLGVIYTIAGYGSTVGGYAGDYGYADTALFNFPNDLALDGNLNLYIADMFNHRIRKIDSFGLGRINTIAGSGEIGFYGDGMYATNAELNNPSGIAVDYNNNVYIADLMNQRIRKVFSSGFITTFAGNGTAGFNADGIIATSSELCSPQGVCVDYQGNLFIADFGNNRIRKIAFVSSVENINAQQPSLEIYPNPLIGNKINIKISSPIDEKVNISIVNLEGQVVLSFISGTNSTNEISSNFGAGIYSVICSSEHGRVVSKISVMPN